MLLPTKDKNTRKHTDTEEVCLPAVWALIVAVEQLSDGVEAERRHAAVLLHRAGGCCRRVADDAAVRVHPSIYGPYSDNKR